MEGEKRILIVDDEVDFVDSLRVRFESEGYEVVTAYDGHEGLRAARDKKPDLIVLDIAMPKLDGYEVCKIIKSDPTLTNMHIAILIETWRDRDQFVESGIDADMFFTKPFDDDVFVEKVKKLLGDDG